MDGGLNGFPRIQAYFVRDDAIWKCEYFVISAPFGTGMTMYLKVPGSESPYACSHEEQVKIEAEFNAAGDKYWSEQNIQYTRNPQAA